MKILFDARVLGNQMHGIARYCHNLLEQLLAEDRGYEYSILFSEPGIPNRFTPSFPVRWLQCRTPLYSLQEQVLIPFQIRGEAFDLFHSPTYSIPWSLVSKGIITIHDLIHLLFPKDYGLRHRLYYSLFTRRAVSQCLKVFTVSEHSRNDIISLLHGPDRKIVVAPNGLDPQWMPQSIDAGLRDRMGLTGEYLLFVGNPRPHKNFLRVFSAFKQLVREDAYPGKMVVVGISPRDLREEMGNRIIFLPLSNDQELRMLYSGADLLAAPSLYEGFGLPVLEAMACGCPVLVGNQGALPEIVGNAGVLVDPYDPDSIYQGIRNILGHPETRRELIELGVQRAALYSWEKTGRKVLETYAELEKGLRS